MFEVENNADAELRDAKVIEHFSAFHIRDLIDPLCVHNDGAEGDEIRNEFPHVLAFVEDLESALLIEFDAAELKDSMVSAFS